jgi:hypothetical protein
MIIEVSDLCDIIETGLGEEALPKFLKELNSCGYGSEVRLVERDMLKIYYEEHEAHRESFKSFEDFRDSMIAPERATIVIEELAGGSTYYVVDDEDNTRVQGFTF